MIKVKSSLKYGGYYLDKVCHPNNTVKRALTSLLRLKMPVKIIVKRIDAVDRLKIPTYLCHLCKQKNFLEGTWLNKNAYGKGRDSIHVKASLEGTWLNKNAYGKGRDSIYAKASALMECIERSSCFYFLKNLKSFKEIDYEHLNVEKISISKMLKAIPKIYGYCKNDKFLLSILKKTPFTWRRVYSLSEKRSFFFPHEWFMATSTGYAAGNTLEEAILQGLCEVIERYTITKLTMTKQDIPSIDIRTINDSVARRLISKFYLAGIKLFIKDFTMGLGIPTVCVLAHDPKGPKSVRIFCAAGTSLNRDVALIRALTEVAQHRAAHLASDSKKYPGQTGEFPLYVNLKEAGALARHEKCIPFSKLPTHCNKDFKEEIDFTLRKLKKIGAEGVVTDVTHPILRMPVVIVNIIGMITRSDMQHPYLKISNQFAEIGDHKEALKILERFFELYPTKKNEKDIVLAIGLLYIKLKRFDKAKKMFRRLISLSQVDNKGILKCKQFEERKFLLDAYKGLRKCGVKWI